MPDFDTENDKLNLFIDTILLLDFLFGLCLTVLMTLYCLYDPRAVIFIGSMIPEEYFHFTLKILVILFHSFVLIGACLHVTIFGGIILVYLFYVTVFLARELRMGERMEYMTTDSLRVSMNIRKVYRSFQVLNGNFMSFFGIFVFFFHSGFTVEIIYSIYILFRFWHTWDNVTKAPLIIGIPGQMGFWSIVLWLGGYLYIKGVKLLKSWERSSWGMGVKEDKIMQKFRRSCEPIVIKHGKQWVIKRVTLLGFIKGITRGSGRALLTLL